MIIRSPSVFFYLNHSLTAQRSDLLLSTQERVTITHEQNIISSKTQPHDHYEQVTWLFFDQRKGRTKMHQMITITALSPDSSDTKQNDVKDRKQKCCWFTQDL